MLPQKLVLVCAFTAINMQLKLFHRNWALGANSVAWWPHAITSRAYRRFI